MSTSSPDGAAAAGQTWSAEALVVAPRAAPHTFAFTTTGEEPCAVVYHGEPGLAAVLAGRAPAHSGTFSTPCKAPVLAQSELLLPPRETLDAYLDASAAMVGLSLDRPRRGLLRAAFGLAYEQRRLGDLPLAAQRAVALAAAFAATEPGDAVIAENPGRGLSDPTRALLSATLVAASRALGVSTLVIEPGPPPAEPHAPAMHREHDAQMSPNTPESPEKRGANSPVEDTEIV